MAQAIRADKWDRIGILTDGDEAVGTYPGCQYRVDIGRDFTLPVNIKVTGRTIHRDPMTGLYGRRVQIEFVEDGEPSTFSGGWLFDLLPE